MPASSTFFDDQRSLLKQMDARKYPGINIKEFLKGAKVPITALYQGKQFKIHDLRTLLTRLSQHTNGIDPTFTKKCTDFVEHLREMDNKHQFSTFDEIIKACKAHVPPLDFKSIFTVLENQYLLCKKDKMWSLDKLILPDPAAVPSSFLSGTPVSTPATTGGIDQAKTDLVKALLAVMKNDDRACHKCGAKDHFANSPKCPKNKFKSRRNNRSKFQPSQRSPSAPSAPIASSAPSTQTQQTPSHQPMRNIPHSSWKKIAPREGQEHFKERNGRTYYWCTTCGSWSTTHGNVHPTAKHVANYSRTSARSARRPRVSYAAAATSATPGTSVNIWNLSVPLQASQSTPFFSVENSYFSLLLGLLVWFTSIVLMLRTDLTRQQMFHFSAIGAIVQSLYSVMSTMSLATLSVNTVSTVAAFNAVYNSVLTFSTQAFACASSIVLSTSQVLHACSQLPLQTFIAPSLWLVTLLLLRFAGPSATLPSYKCKRSVRRHIQQVHRHRKSKLAKFLMRLSNLGWNPRLKGKRNYYVRSGRRRAINRRFNTVRARRHRRHLSNRFVSVNRAAASYHAMRSCGRPKEEEPHHVIRSVNHAFSPDRVRQATHDVPFRCYYCHGPSTGLTSSQEYMNEYLHNGQTMLRPQDFPSQYDLPDEEVSTINHTHSTANPDTTAPSTVVHDKPTAQAFTVPSTSVSAAAYSLIADLRIPDTIQILSNKIRNFHGDWESSCSHFNVIWDSGATISVTGYQSDFIKFSPNVGQYVKDTSVEALNNKIPIKGEGLVRWFLQDSQGTFRCFIVPCILIPQCKHRLISTNVCSNELGESFRCNDAKASMADDILQRQRLNLPYRPSIAVSRCSESHLWNSKGFVSPQTAVGLVSACKGRYRHGSVYNLNNLCIIESPPLANKRVLPGHVRVLHEEFKNAPSDDMEHNPLDPYTFIWVGGNFFCGNNAEHVLGEFRYIENIQANLDRHNLVPPPDIIPPVDPDADTDDNMSTDSDIVPIPDPRIAVADPEDDSDADSDIMEIPDPRIFNVQVTVADPDIDDGDPSDTDSEIESLLAATTAHNPPFAHSMDNDISIPHNWSLPSSAPPSPTFSSSDDATSASLQDLLDRIANSRALRLALRCDIEAGDHDAADALIQAIIDNDDECLSFTYDNQVDDDEPIDNNNSTHSYSSSIPRTVTTNVATVAFIHRRSDGTEVPIMSDAIPPWPPVPLPVPPPVPQLDRRTDNERIDIESEMDRIHNAELEFLQDITLSTEALETSQTKIQDYLDDPSEHPLVQNKTMEAITANMKLASAHIERISQIKCALSTLHEERKLLRELAHNRAEQALFQDIRTSINALQDQADDDDTVLSTDDDIEDTTFSSSAAPTRPSILVTHAEPVATFATSADNLNLTDAQKELVKWHNHLGHIGFDRVKQVLATGRLAKTEGTARRHCSASKAPTPLCAACIYAKQRRNSQPGTTRVVNKDREGVLRADNLFLGQEVSVDHFICSQKGRLFHTRGRESQRDRFVGGSIFVDQASSYVYIEFQSVLTANATLQAKVAYENFCREQGVVPAKYLSDNGRQFTSVEYIQHLNATHQIQRYAGVGAHHQNGHAERHIATIMSIARAQMIHAAIHWPDVADSSLWPMSVNHAVWLWNHVPNARTGQSPQDIFTRRSFQLERFNSVHVWGSPTYVLEKRLQDGMKIPWWKPRSTRGMYLGNARKYASDIPLILNVTTGSITPQFHVVFDDQFATVGSSPDQLPDFNSDEWNKLFGDSSLQYVLDEDDYDTLTDLEQLLSDADDQAAHAQHTSRILDRLESRPRQPMPSSAPVVKPSPDHATLTPLPRHTSSASSSPSFLSNRGNEAPPRATNDNLGLQTPAAPRFAVDPTTTTPTSPPVIATPSTASSIPLSDSSMESPTGKVSSTPTSTSTTITPPNVRRSTRTSKAPQRLTPKLKGKMYLAKGNPTEEDWTLVTTKRKQRVETATSSPDPEMIPLSNESLPPASQFHVYFSAIGCAYPTETAIPTMFSTQPQVLAARAVKDPDIFSYDQAMKTPERKDWMKAAEAEISELENHNVWVEVDKNKVQQQGHKIIPCTWVFCLKRYPDGTPKKYKARIYLRGDLMETKDDKNTYSPVVSPITIRLFLTISKYIGYTTCTFDFSNAFVQADNPRETYMHIPRGFLGEKPNQCLKLLKSIYGSIWAPRLFYNLARSVFKKLGLIKSDVDDCLFYGKNIFVIIYVDDLGVAALNPNDIDKLAADIESHGLTLTKEESFAEYLGIKYTNLPDGSTLANQSGLIKKILLATGMNNCTVASTPALNKDLGIDQEGVPMSEPWSYPSVVGMLLYLSNNTQPDITVAVLQVTHFTHSPKQSHSAAVKRIIRYLKGTINNGTILRVPKKLSLDCFVDANFCRLYNIDPPEMTSSVRSRAGYIIKFCGYPLIWKYQLMDCICLSTAEAEYYALSQAMRALIPVHTLLKEMCLSLNVPEFTNPDSILTTVHEDNQSALRLATEQRITSRTRFYLARYHFFWEHVRNGDISVIYCPTETQEADYLTKNLPEKDFVRIRKLVQGW
ncbi:hypothetical protein CTEN210_14954 [Chaetoceros tenuissimus]|uniref:Integrase catalytic domain-containing protein n=1 Tax=Chaetoceros tenuissimus TaxID=426638 RepID=A0AAD3D635_9STRA|nr:hypothetical protein CTEN210_14954 [Chaetoceros tenuissimus]